MKKVFPFIEYRKGKLYIENIPADDLSEEFGTPLYIYSKNAIKSQFKEIDNSFKNIEHTTCFAVKSNSNIHVLNIIAELGGGADTVSKGEIFKSLIAGIHPQKIVFAGVGKRDDEIEYAIDKNILMFNVESEEELMQINKIAKARNKVAKISIRVNPDVGSNTHPHILTGIKESKFGIDYENVKKAYRKAEKLPNIKPTGIHFHIGSQIMDIAPFVEATQKVAKLVKELKEIGINIEFFNIGGGLGVNYKPEEKPPSPELLAEQVISIIKKLNCKLIIEPGRRILANAGVMLTKVLYTKEKRNGKFVIVDAGMNDLLRPSLYNAYHHIIPTNEKRHGKNKKITIAGPICETSDIFAKNNAMQDLKKGDLLAILSVGAYGFSMSSNYNSRPRPAEVMVDGRDVRLIRRRETLGDLISGEIL